MNLRFSESFHAEKIFIIRLAPDPIADERPNLVTGFEGG